MWQRTSWTGRGLLAAAAVLSLVSASVGQESGRKLKPIASQTARSWTDAAGRRSAEATLLAADGHKARLEKSGGKVVTVSLASLSSADRDFIREQLAAVDNAASTIRTAGNSLTTLTGSTALAAVPGLLDRLSAPIPPNAIYVRISQPFLNRYIKHRVFKRAPINDCILGTPVHGTSQTNGRTELTLTPDPSRACIDLKVTGVADASTVGTHDPVCIFTHTMTGFRSAKHVLVDVKGITQSPAQTEARTRSTTTGISTCLGPLLERIVLRVAWRRVNETRADADRICSQHTARRVDRELDQAVNDAVARIKTAMTVLHDILEDHKIRQPRMLSSTTADYLQIVLLRDDVDERDIASFIPEPTADPKQPDIELAIHSAVVFAALKDSDVRASFQPVMDSLWYQSLLKFSGIAFLSAGKSAAPGYAMQWSEGGEWLKLEWNARGSDREHVARADRK